MKMWLLSGLGVMPSGPMRAWEMVSRLMPMARARRTLTSFSTSAVPLMVMWRKFGPPARRSTIPGVPSARLSLLTSGPMSMKSISPLARASIWALASMAR
jgi:hypothetical protein